MVAQGPLWQWGVGAASAGAAGGPPAGLGSGPERGSAREPEVPLAPKPRGAKPAGVGVSLAPAGAAPKPRCAGEARQQKSASEEEISLFAVALGFVMFALNNS